MKQRRRIYYTETDKALMWDRWEEGESLNSIGRRCDKISYPLPLNTNLRGNSYVERVFDLANY